AVARPDRDRAQSQRHGEEKEERPDVVATAEDERDAADVLRSLDERERRGDQHRLQQPVISKQRVRGRREGEQTRTGEESAGQLDLQRPAEEAPQPSPVLTLLEAEAVFDEGLLDREVEQRLEEPRRRDHEGVQTEDPRRESVGHDHRPEEAEDY